MIVGKIYITILEKKKRRVSSISLSDTHLDSSIIIPFEINASIKKNRAYYSLIITALKQYIRFVSEKAWPKYDKMEIYFDKESNYRKGKLLTEPSLVKETEEFIKIVGGVKFRKAKEDDPYYLACVGSTYNFINKLLGEESHD